MAQLERNTTQPTAPMEIFIIVPTIIGDDCIFVPYLTFHLGTNLFFLCRAINKSPMFISFGCFSGYRK